MNKAEQDAAFVAWVNTLPKGNQAIMWDAMDRGQSYTKDAFYAGLTAGLAALADLEKDTRRLDAFTAWTDQGHAPALVFDDDGHFAVSFTGMQPVPGGDGVGYADMVTIAVIVEAEEWKPDVREAIDAAIAKDAP